MSADAFDQKYYEWAAKDNRAATNMVGLFIGLLVAVIVVVQVFIPVVYDSLADNPDIDGTEATILELLPLFAALLVLIALAGPLMRRM